MALNRKETTVDGRHCALVGDGRIPVRDDLLTALDVMAAFGDPDTPQDFKVAYAMALMFPEIDEGNAGELAGMLPDCCWELYGLDLTGAHASECGGEKAFDWEEDEAMIRASLLSEYGVSVAELSERYSYRDACDLVAMLPFGTPMGRAIYYRVADEPERTQYNGEEVRRFRKLRAHYALKNGKDDFEAMNDAANAAFAGLGVKHG